MSGLTPMMTPMIRKKTFNGGYTPSILNTTFDHISASDLIFIDLRLKVDS